MEYDVSLILFLQSYPALVFLMKLLSLLGTKEFFLLLLPAIYWCGNAAIGFRLGLILSISYGTNAICKLLWHSPRPYWTSRDVFAWAGERSFGLPSGHAQIAASFWGLLAARLASPRAWIAAILLTIAIGVSRIYLGVHFPQDVITGWIIGAGLLVAFIYGDKYLAGWLSGQSLRTQILISFSVSMALLAVFYLTQSALRGWQMPDLWVANAFSETSQTIDPMSAKDALQATGMLFGVSSGYALMLNHGGFSATGPVQQKALRCLLGLAGLMIIWYGLGALSPASDMIIYLRALLAGLWVAYIAPLCFLRMHLAENSQL
jgi:membrane-associated phospholipid phosphatase